VVQVSVTMCSLPLEVPSLSAIGTVGASPEEEHVEIQVDSTRAPSPVADHCHHRPSSPAPAGSTYAGTIVVRRWQPAARAVPSLPCLNSSATPHACRPRLISTGHRHLPNGMGGLDPTSSDADA
jgi:hypothetical protein